MPTVFQNNSKKFSNTKLFFVVQVFERNNTTEICAEQGVRKRHLYYNLIINNINNNKN